MLTLELPYPPSQNRIWRRVGPRTLLSAEARRYYARAEVLVFAHMLEAGFDTVPGKFDVEIDLYPPDRRRRDPDNAIKVLLDSLQKGRAVSDDCNLRRLVLTNRGVVKGGRVVVRLWGVG